jgi:hypothetical protein
MFAVGLSNSKYSFNSPVTVQYCNTLGLDITNGKITLTIDRHINKQEKKLIKINCVIPVMAGVYLHCGMTHIVEFPKYECLSSHL